MNRRRRGRMDWLMKKRLRNLLDENQTSGSSGNQPEMALNRFLQRWEEEKINMEYDSMMKDFCLWHDQILFLDKLLAKWTSQFTNSIRQQGLNNYSDTETGCPWLRRSPLVLIESKWNSYIPFTLQHEEGCFYNMSYSKPHLCHLPPIKDTQRSGWTPIQLWHKWVKPLMSEGMIYKLCISSMQNLYLCFCVFWSSNYQYCAYRGISQSLIIPNHHSLDTCICVFVYFDQVTISIVHIVA